ENFYLDGTFSVKYVDGNKEGSYLYANGTRLKTIRVYKEKDVKEEERIDVRKDGNNYLVIKTKCVYDGPLYGKYYLRDSVVEKYENRKPLVKEKYHNGIAVFKNDKINGIKELYDTYGSLKERHTDTLEERFGYQGVSIYKKVYDRKNRKVLIYIKGKLTETEEFIPAKTIIKKYDSRGNIIKTLEEEQGTGGMEARKEEEYDINSLYHDEFLSYKVYADNLESKTKH
ncbi:MAG: hypothetical protein ACK5MZ_05905, partial [Aestuariibaculum sp.]